MSLTAQWLRVFSNSLFFVLGFFFSPGAPAQSDVTRREPCVGAPASDYFPRYLF